MKRDYIKVNTLVVLLTNIAICSVAQPVANCCLWRARDSHHHHVRFNRMPVAVDEVVAGDCDVLSFRWRDR